MRYVQATIKDDLFTKLKIYCFEKGRTLNAMLGDAIEHYLEYDLNIQHPEIRSENKGSDKVEGLGLPSK